MTLNCHCFVIQNDTLSKILHFEICRSIIEYVEHKKCIYSIILWNWIIFMARPYLMHKTNLGVCYSSNITFYATSQYFIILRVETHNDVGLL